MDVHAKDEDDGSNHGSCSDESDHNSGYLEPIQSTVKYEDNSGYTEMRACSVNDKENSTSEYLDIVAAEPLLGAERRSRNSRNPIHEEGLYEL